MVTFNDIRITNESPRLLSIDIIDEIDTLEDITIVLYSDMGDDGTYDSDKAFRHEIDSERENSHHYVADLTIDVINAGSQMNLLSFDKVLFYIIVRTIDAASEQIHTYTAVIPDWKAIYDIGLPFIAQIASRGFDKCQHSANFEEFIIIWNALLIAFSSGDYAQIDMLWRRFLRFSGFGSTLTSECPCSK